VRRPTDKDIYTISGINGWNQTEFHWRLCFVWIQCDYCVGRVYAESRSDNSFLAGVAQAASHIDRQFATMVNSYRRADLLMLLEVVDEHLSSLQLAALLKPRSVAKGA
jgi:hypothetical protein